MSLGAKLTELRLRKGESLQDVANAVCVSKTHIWHMEKGNSGNPSLDLLRKLADHFSVPVSYLAGTDDESSLEDVEAQQFFRDFKSLSEAEQDVLKQTLQLFKSKKARVDGPA
ncbi:helix-turn-helix domain-containing protein [Burkholderia stagnalis]|uniref:helix-turn-helix domain-containing protein n=1 Tax=Burkholderia stagnalis TaxID=1503054 RepID=UPI000F5B07CB|nr:helix-turn-helix transcriptional regulator [Burkholderia stagnalis]RQQ29896.1 XRE family transcriptional regulator [Burkholderia stagnalis]RQQ95212.1 XRE family transcriptional regulator [Burkholderia stagnalis]RQX86173.1 XRE family transcriptional regulator [Burkholderia stagnalis]